MKTDFLTVSTALKTSARELGFSDCRISDVDLGNAPEQLRTWLAAGMHGSMHYMAQHAALRSTPTLLQPGCVRAICVRLDYLSEAASNEPALPPAEASPGSWQERSWKRLATPLAANISLYAQGRDYHKAVRQRLQKLADVISAHLPHHYRVFSDSAPVMEVALATKAGLGWRGKHTLLLNREGGSLFFLGEILTDCPLPLDAPISDHCGACSACIDVCPTQAIIGPYQLDARRCISYLTIEHKGSIAPELRPLIGNRIYGCDDCQLACPWNKFAQIAQVPDFAPRNGLDSATLLELFEWTQAEFDQRLQGSAIRRIGHAQWLRNIAIALGNAPPSTAILTALETQAQHPDAVVAEHVSWAIEQQSEKLSNTKG
jgi:epoxyqueuosine reductase